MRRYLPVTLAAVVAFAGLLLMSGSELLSSVASENIGRSIDGRLTDYSWQMELSGKWLSYLIGLFHPLQILIFSSPVLAVAAWAGFPRVAWLLCASAVFLFGLDVYVFLGSIEQSGGDLNGCQACFGMFVLHAFAALIGLVLIVVGAVATARKRAHV